MFAPRWWISVLLSAWLAGCSTSKSQAPVVERSVSGRPSSQGQAPAATPPGNQVAQDSGQRPPPGAENAGKPGYYSVKPGDTLIRIGLDNGQNWRDIVRWNGIDNPNLIEVGQVLRVVPPSTDAAAVAARGAPAARAEARPLEAKPPAAAASAPSASPTAANGVASLPPSPVAAASAATPAPAASPASTVAAPTEPAARDVDDGVQWLWPASGPVGGSFEEGRSKGLAILGKAGDPVLAAADGRVVYAGSGLRGYGNLVIVKHNSTYLTAYAHNQALLVKEDQPVRRGQKIAEMGSTDAERVQLHFEIRRQGKPIDPARLLPAR
ncbi:peptidoglycan DD-metalloendopeptidase family protein [Ideonella sp. A 288]|uniref:peptidoglycan DD-metalloendopeptidase family protein n=1 Tax=Ideonella sp. A 288 TaxID=1962181 RepID=UPI000B4B8056|nr:peptidoglycan DD-metalloendopeptidase family protein [Ideonella sp. A 288]